MEKIKRNGKIINIFKYTDSFLNELISMGPDEFEDEAVPFQQRGLSSGAGRGEV